MSPFHYNRAADVGQALAAVAERSGAKFLGGGTNLIDLMKMGVETPTDLVDLHRLPLSQIEELENKSVRLGAMARNSDVAEHPLIRERYPVLCQALLAGASPQLRNMATVGGNLMQRTRCCYFYDPAFPACNKRVPGSGCGAIQGYNRMHAILGQSEHCIATHPSDMCVALSALDAIVRVHGPQSERAIPLDEFHRLPGDHPESDTTLARDELITAVDLPAASSNLRSHYLKVRDRASYAFALVSVAVVLDMGEDGKVRRARVALGGVAHKPWRAKEAEEKLTGVSAGPEVFRAAADAALAQARGYPFNSFKIELARRSIVRALTTAAASNA
ncbi:MAG TPA: xanthine dehydrogenase family protein subunit M [Verrucomicrobiaceae bacterium]